MSDYFVTVSTAEWMNSPYVPKSNGKVMTDRNADGNITDCWYIDSRIGKWTTLTYSLEYVSKGDTAVLAFWAKLSFKGRITFMLENFQEDWEKRTTFPLLKSSSYIAGQIGDYYLFSVSYIAASDYHLNFALSVNDIEAFIFPATESDLKRSDLHKQENAEIMEKERYQIINCYKQDFPKTRFVGIKYGDEDRVDGMFGWLWGQWFETGKFDTLEKNITEEFKAAYPDTDAYIGLMRYKEGEPFEYWIGMFLPEGCSVPDGFSCVDFDFDYAGICWVKGQEEFIYGNETVCHDKLLENGMKVMEDKQGACWFFERYGCPRFTTPDDDNEIILDIGYFVEGC